jgi:hypothetical protein
MNCNTMNRTAMLPWSDDRPKHRKQLALFCYLVQVCWQLSERIPWDALSRTDRLKLEAVLPMLVRLSAKTRSAIRNPEPPGAA